MLKNIIIYSTIIGIIVGSIFNILQNLTTIPMILKIENYKINKTNTYYNTDNNIKKWTPKNGIERTTYNTLFTILITIGFAMLIISLMIASNKINILNGIFFGLAGYISFYIAPSLILIPEILEINDEQLKNKQNWWLITVFLTASSLGIFAFIKNKFKFLGLILIIIPHILNTYISKYSTLNYKNNFTITDNLTNLLNNFTIINTIILFIFWILLGIASSLIVKKFIKIKI